MINKKNRILVMITLITMGININSVKVEAIEGNSEITYFNSGENIEKENVQSLDDRELKIDFDAFEKNKDFYKKNENRNIKEITKNYKGVDIIESNLKWNGELDLSNKPKTLVLHHIEASRPGQTIPVTDVHQWHLANGWAGIGYHFYVTKTGKIYRGRPENAIGAHAKNFNIDSLGIAVEGKYGVESMPQTQRQAVEKLGGYLRGKYNIDVVKGHGEMMATSCPGKNYPLNQIRGTILSYPTYPEPEAPSVNGLAVQYESHVQNEGWQRWVKDGEMSGTTGQAKRTEGIRIKLANSSNSSISYRAHVQDEGWKNWVKDGVNAGTKGESKRIEAIQIVLEGEIAKTHDIEYRVHVQDEGWHKWVKNGDFSGTTGKARRVEGIQMKLVEKPIHVKYQTHIQDIGWQGISVDGQISGTTGKSKAIESIKVNVGQAISGVNVKYRVHGQEYGWQNWVNDGQLAGTVGQSKRIEAIEMKLEGEKANNYNIEYRVHVQNMGWMPWSKNGNTSGTVGQSKRIEAIEIKISNK